MSDEMNQVGQKKYKYKRANIHFSWNEEGKNADTETTVKIVWEFITSGDKSEKHTYIRTTAQVDSFYMPLLRIVKGYDSMSTALLYVNDTYAKGIYLRMIEQGVDFLSISGIVVNEDGTWRIE